MADDRRILNSLHIIPKESAELEEGNTKWALLQQDARGQVLSRKLGGKSINTVVANNPWGNGWFSGIPDTQNWEDMGEIWNVSGDIWSDKLNIDDSGQTIAQGTVPPSTKVNCCWIKNLSDEAVGPDIDVKISLNGGNTYPIIIKPGGGFYFNNILPTLYIDRIWAKATSGDETQLEYIIVN